MAKDTKPNKEAKEVKPSKWSTLKGWQKALIIIVGIFVVIMIITPSGDTKEPSNDKEIEKTTTEEKVDEPTEDTTPEAETKEEKPKEVVTKSQAPDKEAIIKSRVMDYAKSKLGKDNIREVTVKLSMSPDIKGYIVTVYYNIDVYGKTKEDEKRRAIEKAVTMYNGVQFTDGESIFKFDEEVGMVNVVGYMKLQDVKGQEFENRELRIKMKRSTWESINWKNFYSKNIGTVADDYGEGEYLRKIKTD